MPKLPKSGQPVHEAADAVMLGEASYPPDGFRSRERCVSARADVVLPGGAWMSRSSAFPHLDSRKFSFFLRHIESTFDCVQTSSKADREDSLQFQKLRCRALAAGRRRTSAPGITTPAAASGSGPPTRGAGVDPDPGCAAGRASASRESLPCTIARAAAVQLSTR